MRKLILTLWQLPQHLLAMLILLVLRSKITGKKAYLTSTVHTLKGIKWGVSLGSHIIVGTNKSLRVIKHEYGHSRQSLMLGWFYLLVVGLPSITMNILTRLKILRWQNYYKRWPESWADKLGEVKN